MAADTSLLQGEIIDDPASQKLDVERMLAAFLHALLEEQRRDDRQAAPAASEEQA